MLRYTIRPRIRIIAGDGTIVLGPGKADLLEAIAGTGSIRGAASALRMSYMRAWTLVRVMNSAFRSPLVEKIRGGPAQGGARLTKRGERVLTLYRDMERVSREAVHDLWSELRHHI